MTALPRRSAVDPTATPRHAPPRSSAALRTQLAGAAAGSSPIFLQTVGAEKEHLAQLRGLSGTALGLNGGGVLEGNCYDARCTHMVVHKAKRTEKMLAGLAAGVWVLEPRWLTESAAAGRWLPEADYEFFAPGDVTTPFGGGYLTLWMGAARSHRRCREQYNRGAFEGQNIVVAASDETARRIRCILLAGGATVLLPAELSTDSRVSLVVLPEDAPGYDTLRQEAVRHGAVCVPVSYVYLQLTSQAPPSLESYQP